ncbi:MAG: excinuclease ABC subunit UvrC [Chloroflexi bacterium]|nr:excinuclease ABC subunit UvrC [Chloroflexota bacterium]MBA3739850.1 excinuclease ABC subunit UvrC [Chloroflexota bacterium]
MSPQRALSDKLRGALRRLPTKPGVYLMQNADGRVLYVGKADSLRSRVRSYFAARGPEDARIARMVTEVAGVEYIVTDTVSEAYLLESNLIKEHRPRFNIRLRDDKSYPFVKITLGEDFPRIVRTRRLVRDGSRYFGPYASASSVDETLKLLRKIFPFRTCNLDIPEGKRVLERPCLLYFINRCQGPCIQAVPKSAYRETIGQIVDFLDGKQEPIARQLRREMEGQSEALRFEQAATTRDKLRAVERTMEQQKMAAFSRAEHDVIGMARDDDAACVQVMQVRNGKLIGREHFIVEGARDVSDATVLGSFLQQYYASTDAVPRALLAPLMPAEADDLAAYLAERRGVRVTISVPERGEKRRLVAMATSNAVEALAREHAEWMADTSRRDEALSELASALELPRPPERIECYDMSNIQGTSAVGSMVVFIDGRPEPKEYRRFRIRSGETPDDFRMMAEVLRRRFSRVAKLRSETGALSLDAVGADEVPEEDSDRRRDVGWAMPDLVIVDGGKGQLSAAVGVMDELGIRDVPFSGLAKRFEELHLPGRSAPVVLPRRSQALYLVQRIRDEAHRFAITYHRDVRGKKALRSELDDIGGIGPGRKRTLLRRFGSVRRIREASVEEVAATPGISRELAERLKAHLAREGMLA